MRPDDKLFPFVTVIMPIRNEGNYIVRSLNSVLAQDYPGDRMEILVVDGRSDDGTRDLVTQEIAQQEAQGDAPHIFPKARIELLDNPGRIVPTAFNIGLGRARGEIIVRVDGHCEIAPNYVRQIVNRLSQLEASAVGGPMSTIGENRAARAISVAQSSWFGVGGVAFRTGRKEGCYVDTVAFGGYRREVFERLGGFDEELVRNQDDEFNLRLTQSGGKIWLDPAIRSVYYSRAGFRSLWRQYFQYGFYKVRVMQKHRTVPAWRHLVPAMFVSGLALSLFCAAVSQNFFWFVLVIAPYIVANFSASLLASRQDWRMLPLVSLAFLTLHVAYGSGFLNGLWHWRKYWRRVPEG
jgi:glycosyltransferase involved in cell wall biosynthesis